MSLVTVCAMYTNAYLANSPSWNADFIESKEMTNKASGNGNPFFVLGRTNPNFFLPQYHNLPEILPEWHLLLLLQI